MKKSGASTKLINNLLVGRFTPVNYSRPRFESKVQLVKEQMKRLNKDSDEFRYKANRSFLFPQVELDKVIGKYNGIKFFEEAYDPDQENYQIDKNGRLLLDENRNPIKEEGFIQRNIKKIPGAIKDLILPGSPKSGFQSKIQTPPLDDMPMPMKMASNTQQKNSISNLTRTEEALLSPSEKIIAGRTT
jgi:hypothetical protein